MNHMLIDKIPRFNPKSLSDHYHFRRFMDEIIWNIVSS